MQVIEEITNKPIRQYQSKLVVIEYSNEGGFIKGYVHADTPTKQIYFKGLGLRDVLVSTFGEENIAFSNKKGVYIAKNTYTPNELLVETKTKGFGAFPYMHIMRNYEAVVYFQIY